MISRVPNELAKTRAVFSASFFEHLVGFKVAEHYWRPIRLALFAEHEILKSRRGLRVGWPQAKNMIGLLCIVCQLEGYCLLDATRALSLGIFPGEN